MFSYIEIERNSQFDFRYLLNKKKHLSFIGEISALTYKHCNGSTNNKAVFTVDEGIRAENVCRLSNVFKTNPTR